MSISNKEEKVLKRTRKVNRDSTIPNTAATISSGLNIEEPELSEILDDLHEREYVGTKLDVPSAKNTQ